MKSMQVIIVQVLESLEVLLKVTDGLCVPPVSNLHITQEAEGDTPLMKTSASKLQHLVKEITTCMGFVDSVAHNMSTVDFYETNALQIERGSFMLALQLQCCSESAVGAMATKEMWEQIGEGFVGEYYRRFDKNELRPSLGELYGNDSCLTWEGEGFPGRTAIVGKLTGLPFGAIQHVITSQDHQPTPDNCIVSMVTGQLKADNDPVMGFQQIFMLKLQDGAWVCTNDIFRLALHNFAA